MKNLIDWGIYKSNKIYYKEIEEQKKTMKVSFFSFSIASLTKSLKSVAALEKVESNKVEEGINNQELPTI